MKQKYRYGLALTNTKEALYPPKIQNDDLIQDVELLTLTRWSDETDHLVKFTFKSNFLYNLISEHIGSSNVSVKTDIHLKFPTITED